MNTSRQLAGFIGPVGLALAASELLNYHIWDSNIPAVTYLNGTLLLVAGLAIVRVHNLWSVRWPVLITLAGWSCLAGGLARMFAPEAKQVPAGTAVNVGLLLLCVICLFLSFRGYAPAGPPEQSADSPS